MHPPPSQFFGPEIIDRLQTYVYRLIDPRNGETFYVGKGKGNRIFAHIFIKPEIDPNDDNNKVKRIREIHLAGFEVAHVIHRHGMDEETAFHVESALIDAYPGLANEIKGRDGTEFGVKHADQIIRDYSAQVAIFTHKAILISVNRTALEENLYEATRYAWKISRQRAQAADLILATVQGIIKGAFIAEQWLDATAENFPGKATIPGRLGFVGREAPPELQAHYVGKRIPNTYRKPGAANPIKYAWPNSIPDESEEKAERGGFEPPIGI